MNTNQMRAAAQEQAKLGFPTSSVAMLEAAAATIDKLRAHAKAQRAELRRLNAALARRHDPDICTTLADVPRSIRSLENAVRGWSSATALATRQLTDALRGVKQ